MLSIRSPVLMPPVLNNTTSIDPSLVPLSAKQQASEVVATSSVGPMQGNDIYHLRCPAALSVLKEGKMIDVSCVNCQSLNPPCRYCHEGAQHLCDMPLDTSNTEVAKAPSQPQPQPSLLEVPIPTMPTTTTTIVPLELLQVQQSAEIVSSPCTVLDIQGNDTGRMRCPAPSVFKEGKMIDVSCVNCQSLNPPCRYYHEGTQHLCDMPLDSSNTEVAKAPSQPQPQPPLLEAPVPTMPTAIVVPLESSQVQQSTEVVNVPCAVLDIQGNDIGRQSRSSTASISKEGKKVDVANINDMRLQPSGLRCNLSLPTSDTLAKLPPQLKPPLLEAPVPTIPTAPVVRLSVEQQAAVLVAVHQNDNCHIKPSGILKVKQ